MAIADRLRIYTATLKWQVSRRTHPNRPAKKGS